MHVKSAPSASRSASTSRFAASGGKRGRTTGTDKTSESSSAEADDDDDDDDENDDDDNDRAPKHAKLFVGQPHSSTYLGAAATSKASHSMASTGQPSTNFKASRSYSLNNEGTAHLGAVFMPIVLSSSSDESEEHEREKSGSVRQPSRANGQSHRHIFPPNGALQQGSVLGRGGQQSPKSYVSRKTVKLTCEERRLQLCDDFDSAKFDAMIYGQTDASRPPIGVFALAAPIANSKRASSSSGDDGRFHMKLDPRIHWPHHRSSQWYNSKMEEIKARGGRKANFGKAAKRMRQQRLAEERQEVEERLAVSQGEPWRLNKSPQPWSHHRPMDFGDVPEEELPVYVRKNEEWMRAVAWMRKMREESIQRDGEAAARHAAGGFTQHLSLNGR
ncbi:hypothetical protein CORC01_05586 [Colletotrichum orchidophilum]|uniref:Uncharacterized protein n=1 Tax=Colletotrichum orchidophilum TaxID=1209926 RepID=A0A1G4BCG9_9PEZI|nr:uncharacterized protein CORC01_05586 [Colletotrichum orchidophilum]OHE99093.1 hypothetical protein CORC01_05586 [Colletotrichum orchidophilum]